MSIENNMNLSAEVSVIIRKFLIDNSIIGGNPGSQGAGDWPSTYDAMPDSIDQIVTVFHGKGVQEPGMMDGSEVYHPSAQIMIRTSTNGKATAWKKLHDISELFSGVGVHSQAGPNQPIVEIEGDRFQIKSAFPISPPITLGVERRDNTSQASQRVPKEAAKPDRFLYTRTYLFTIIQVE